MKQKSLILTGPKNLKWEKYSMSPLKKDEVLIKTIAGAISIGAELPQYNESISQIRTQLILEIQAMKVTVKCWKWGVV